MKGFVALVLLVAQVIMLLFAAVVSWLGKPELTTLCLAWAIYFAIVKGQLK